MMTRSIRSRTVLVAARVGVHRASTIRPRRPTLTITSQTHPEVPTDKRHTTTTALRTSHKIHSDNNPSNNIITREATRRVSRRRVLVRVRVG